MISGVSSAYVNYSSPLHRQSAATAAASSANSGQADGIGSDSSTTPSSIASSAMSIPQIRNITDRMAVDGKLTIKQQMALIGGGLMDPNPENPSYQPTTSGIRAGYSRSDTGSYNFVGMMQGSAAEATSSGDAQLADIYSGIAQSFQDYVSSQGYGTSSRTNVLA